MIFIAGASEWHVKASYGFDRSMNWKIVSYQVYALIVKRSPSKLNVVLNSFQQRAPVVWVKVTS